MPSMICRTNFERMSRVADHLGNELVADVGEVVAVRSGHVVDRAVAHVLESARHARRAMVLEHRNADDLVDDLGDQLAQVRAVLPVVLRVVAVGDQVHPDEGVGIISCDRVVAERGEIELELVAAFGGQPPQRMSDGRIL